MTIGVVDYGIGNVQSIINALTILNSTAVLSSDKNVLSNMEGIILPGVGAFKKAMEELKKRNLDAILYELVKTNKPFLGICLGMQLLFEESEEFGFSKGLGWIEGRVEKFPATINEKLPHISWNNLHRPNGKKWGNSILKSITEKDDLYFVHSFICVPRDSKFILATTEYGGISFCSAVQKNNIFGCQFHPEKSGEYGLNILAEFIRFAGNQK